MPNFALNKLPRPVVPSRRRTSRFSSALPKVSFILPDNRTKLDLHSKATNALDAIIDSGLVVGSDSFIDPSGVLVKLESRIVNIDGREVVFRFKEKEIGGTRRKWIDEIDIGDKTFTNLQFYIDGGFAIVEDTFLGLDQIGLVGERTIKIQDDSNFEKIDQDIDKNTGKVRRNDVKDDENVCLACSASSNKQTEDEIKIHYSYDFWYGEGMNIYVDEKQADKGENIVIERYDAKDLQTLRDPEEYGFKIERSMENLEVESENVETEKTEIRDEKRFEEKQKEPEIVEFKDREITQEENPIIRCIMDPVFRKLYGRMYGFYDEDEKQESIDANVDEALVQESDKLQIEEVELENSELKEDKVAIDQDSEIEERNDPELPEISKEKIVPEERKTDIKDRRRTEETPISKRKTKKTTNKKVEIVKLEKAKVENKKEINTKTKRKNKISIGRRVTITKTIKSEIEKPLKQSTRVRIRLRRIETLIRKYFGEKFKFTKAKLREFKAQIIRLKARMKKELKLFLNKVKTYFKLTKKLRLLKQKLQNIFIIRYTKMKIQKLVKKLEIKVKQIKVQIKKIFSRIKNKIVKLLKKLLNIKENILELEYKINALKSKKKQNIVQLIISIIFGIFLK